jgi:4-hydroxy-2-oxoheptanedioate aldolase
MRENKLKTLWANGGAAINGWCGIPDSFAAENMAHAPFDSVTVDMQHGMVDYQVAVRMLQAISTTDKTPMVRVPWNDPIPIMKCLDAGAYGIVCPMINNRAEAEKFIGACRYAPDGYRSLGPPRGLLYGGPDYVEKANETILTLAMIETREAMENLDEIMSTPGLDAVYVGPNDLALSLGFKPSPNPTVPEVLDAISTIAETAKKHGIVPTIHCANGEMAARMQAQGFQLMTIANDTRLMVLGATQECAIARGEA